MRRNPKIPYEKVTDLILFFVSTNRKDSHMGIEGVENLTDGEALDDSVPEQKASRPTDQEIRDRQDAELAAEREEHNRRMRPKTVQE